MEFSLRNGGVPGSDSDLICLSLPSIILKKRNNPYPGTSLFTVSQQHPPLCRERVQEMLPFIHRSKKRVYSAKVEKPQENEKFRKTYKGEL